MRLNSFVALLSFAWFTCFATLPTPTAAQCVGTTRTTTDPAFSNANIGLTLTGVPSNRVDGLKQGMNKWNDTSCNTNSTSFPQFQLGSTSGRLIEVVWNEGLNLDNPFSCGGFQGTKIQLYTQVKNPVRDNQVEGCGGNSVLAQTFAHELGHALGLADQFSTSCRGYIMYQREYNDDGLLLGRNIQDAECSMADQLNKTQEEYDEEIDEPLGSDPEPTTDPTCTEEPCSPIVIDLSGNGFRFTDLDHGVSFDIDADGQRDQVSWTDRFSDEAFLALDRNGNGTIDDGSELFGDATAQPASDDPNGFRALAVFDAPEQGGNGDGWISADDAIFSRLLLWVDDSHDGLAQPFEMRSLAGSGIEAIHLTYVRSGRRDPHGNLLRWGSLVSFVNHRRLAAVDVIFLKE